MITDQDFINKARLDPRAAVAELIGIVGAIVDHIADDSEKELAIWLIHRLAEHYRGQGQLH
jgi:hypothetical protein